jgi:hypothetical protein
MMRTQPRWMPQLSFFVLLILLLLPSSMPLYHLFIKEVSKAFFFHPFSVFHFQLDMDSKLFQDMPVSFSNLSLIFFLFSLEGYQGARGIIILSSLKIPFLLFLNNEGNEIPSQLVKKMTI